jgi:hypothetical protein
MNGWVKLWRKSLRSDIFADANLWRLFCWCLLRANRKSRHVSIRTGRGSTIVALAAGQFVTGRKKGGAELGWAGNTYRRRLNQLASMGVVVIKPGTHFSIVSIVNWGTYQASGRKSGQAIGQATGQATGQAKGTDKKSKKKEKCARTFVKPSLEEVQAYCLERKNAVDPQRFLNHYTSNGWRVGQNAMKSWQAAVRNWEGNGYAHAQQAKTPEPIKYRA